ncbi:UxaA family hydrolase, partial [Micromonospora chalcea]
MNYQWQKPDVSRFANRTFNGYHRKDGRVGTANYWLFIPTVFCENRNLDVIKESLYHTLGYAVTDKYRSFTDQLLTAFHEGAALESFQLDHIAAAEPVKNRVFKNVDGIKFLNHQGGCGGT